MKPDFILKDRFVEFSIWENTSMRSRLDSCFVQAHWVLYDVGPDYNAAVAVYVGRDEVFGGEWATTTRMQGERLE